MSRPEPIIEFAHSINKSTADFTAGDMSKFMKWWLKQPIREDLEMKITGKKKAVVDVRKKVTTKTVQKAKEPVKEVVKEKPMIQVRKPVPKAVTKTVIREAPKTTQQVTKKVTPKVPEPRNPPPGRSFDAFQQKKQAWREAQAAQEPIVDEIVEDFVEEELPVEVDQEDESLVRYEDDVVEEGTDEDEGEEEQIEGEGEDQGEEEQVEQVEEVADDEPVVNMGLTQLDVEALEHLLINGLEMMEIPDEYVDPLNSLLEALTASQQQED